MKVIWKQLFGVHRSWFGWNGLQAVPSHLPVSSLCFPFAPTLSSAYSALWAACHFQEGLSTLADMLFQGSRGCSEFSGRPTDCLCRYSIFRLMPLSASFPVNSYYLTLVLFPRSLFVMLPPFCRDAHLPLCAVGISYLASLLLGCLLVYLHLYAGSPNFLCIYPLSSSPFCRKGPPSA